MELNCACMCYLFSRLCLWVLQCRLKMVYSPPKCRVWSSFLLKLFGLVTGLCAAETVFSSQHPQLSWGQVAVLCPKNTIFNLQRVKVVELEIIRMALCWDEDSCRQHISCQK